jgi:hypothetical protein
MAKRTHDAEFMRAGGAFSWYLESDQAMRSTIVAIAWLDGRPGPPIYRDGDGDPGGTAVAPAHRTGLRALYLRIRPTGGPPSVR